MGVSNTWIDVPAVPAGNVIVAVIESPLPRSSPMIVPGVVAPPMLTWPRPNGRSVGRQSSRVPPILIGADRNIALPLEASSSVTMTSCSSTPSAVASVTVKSRVCAWPDGTVTSMRKVCPSVTESGAPLTGTRRMVTGGGVGSAVVTGGAGSAGGAPVGGVSSGAPNGITGVSSGARPS